MKKDTKVKVGIVGVGGGKSFIDIFRESGKAEKRCSNWKTSIS
jgi:hypothetical protein